MNDAPHPTPQPGPVAAAPAAAAVYPVLLLMLVLSGLDQTVLSTALPAIVADLHGQAGLVSWVFSAYLMASTAVIPVYGKLADRLGVRPLLLLPTRSTVLVLVLVLVVLLRRVFAGLSMDAG